MAYDGSIKIDTKVDTSGFSSGIGKMKTIAAQGVSVITTSLAAVSTAIIAGGTAATKVGSEFESAMAKVSAISGAAGNDLQKLTDKAKEMGATTKFSASESAEALQYMAMAGWKTEDMLGGISGIMSLAAADGLDLATTSDIVTDAITAFGLKAQDSSHFADVLAKASSSANTNVSMLGESFKYVAPLAGTMGYSVEDVSVALGLMANASVKGSMAGTSLKTALSNLASPSKNMKEIMDQYSISISDANGNAMPLIDVLKELREKFGGLSETEQAAAASTLFGKEAMSGMLAIINASDSDFNTLTENINNADGAAQSMADTMQDNLQGQITILKSSLEGLGIEIYEGMSTPLKDAAIEAQNYVNRLTEAFKSDGLSGMIEEAGSIFGELAVKAAQEAPKMVEAAIGFIQSFADGIAKNADQLADAAVSIIQSIIHGVVKAAPKLLSAAKTIVRAIVDNLVKLLPSEVQKPVKDTINTIRKSFESGGLRNAINTVKTIIQNLGKVITNVAKVVLPPLAKAVEFTANNLSTLLPILVSVYAAYKTWNIISTITTLFTAHTAAVTAESLAEAASLGTITLKQIAVGALTGEITLATAAQYAWNLAMSLNPIGIVIMAVAGLAAGIGALAMTMSEADSSTKELELAQESLAQANENLSGSYDAISEKFGDFLSGIENAGSVFDNFNEEILISDEDKQALADNMNSVQGEITEICRNAADERRELTGGEIQRLDELFQKMHELSEQELALEQAKQGVVTTQAQALNDAAGISLEEYTERSNKLANTAEETRTKVIDKAYEQYSEEVALLDLRLQTDAEYSEKEHTADVQAAEKRYQDAIDAANKEAGDTLKILKQGYYDRADALKTSTETLKGLRAAERNESWYHSAKMREIDDNYNRQLEELKNKGYSSSLQSVERDRLLQEKAQKEKEEEVRHNKEQARIKNEDSKILGNENYQNQLKGFLELESLYETYTGKTEKQSEGIVNAFFDPMKNMDEETKQKFRDSLGGAIKGLEEREGTLYWKAQQIASTFISKFKSMFQEHSPSKVFRKIFGYTIEGGEIGAEDEAEKLYDSAESIGGKFTERLKNSVSVDGLVAKMRSAIELGRSAVASKLTANVVHSVNINTDDYNRRLVLKGDVHTALSIDGRELAVVTAPYVSEELAWRGEFD